MTDNFAGTVDTLEAPSRFPFAITPHDSLPLTIIQKRIFVGSGGHVTLRGMEGEAVIYRNAGDGVYLNIRPMKRDTRFWSVGQELL